MSNKITPITGTTHSNLHGSVGPNPNQAANYGTSSADLSSNNSNNFQIELAPYHEKTHGSMQTSHSLLDDGSGLGLRVSANTLVGQDLIDKSKQYFFSEFREKFAKELHLNNNGKYVYTKVDVSLQSSTCYNFYECCLACTVIGMFFLARQQRKQREQEEIPSGIYDFSSRIAMGLVYRYQDHIPILHHDSLNSLINYLVSTYIEYVEIGDVEDRGGPLAYITTYRLLVRGGAYTPYRKSNIILRTNNGFALTIDELVYSTGIRTMYQGEYLPKSRKRRSFLEKNDLPVDFPKYKWGTTDDVQDLNTLSEKKNRLRVVIADTKETIAKKTARTKNDEFWKKTEELAKQYLSEDQYAKYIP